MKGLNDGFMMRARRVFGLCTDATTLLRFDRFYHAFIQALFVFYLWLIGLLPKP